MECLKLLLLSLEGVNILRQDVLEQVDDNRDAGRELGLNGIN